MSDLMKKLSQGNWVGIIEFQQKSGGKISTSETKGDVGLTGES